MTSNRIENCFIWSRMTSSVRNLSTWYALRLLSRLTKTSLKVVKCVGKHHGGEGGGSYEASPSVWNSKTSDTFEMQTSFPRNVVKIHLQLPFVAKFCLNLFHQYVPCYVCCGKCLLNVTFSFRVEKQVSFQILWNSVRHYFVLKLFEISKMPPVHRILINLSKQENWKGEENIQLQTNNTIIYL